MITSPLFFFLSLSLFLFLFLYQHHPSTSLNTPVSLFFLSFAAYNFHIFTSLFLSTFSPCFLLFLLSISTYLSFVSFFHILNFYFFPSSFFYLTSNPCFSSSIFLCSLYSTQISPLRLSHLSINAFPLYSTRHFPPSSPPLSSLHTWLGGGRKVEENRDLRSHLR